MRFVVLVVLVVLVPCAVPADEAASIPGSHSKRAPDVDVFVPVEPREHERLHYFGRRDHHLVPGTVTINGPAYLCDVDGRRFGERDDFVAHLRTVHRLPAGDIPDLLVVRDGRVHFIGK